MTNENALKAILARFTVTAATVGSILWLAWTTVDNVILAAPAGLGF